MTTTLIRQPAGLVTVAPRGAVWAADFFAAIYKMLEETGRRRARQALLELAEQRKVINPGLAADLRAAARRPRTDA